MVNQKISLQDVNQTSIALIPKCKRLVRLGDVRPINLCNVVYKIVAKLLANRLINILDEIIFPTQSAFVPGRLIIDNMLIAYEILHSTATSNNIYMALKLDMSKAYNWIE